MPVPVCVLQLVLEVLRLVLGVLDALRGVSGVLDDVPGYFLGVLQRVPN